MYDKRSFLKGLALGLAGKPLEFAPGKEPVAYLYNGLKLQELPESDLPYAYITKAGNVITGELTKAALVLSSHPIFVRDVNSITKHLLTKQPAHVEVYSCDFADFDGNLIQPIPAWEYTNERTGDAPDEQGWCYAWAQGIMREEYGLWANHDIYYADTGELYLAASDPVPVYE